MDSFFGIDYPEADCLWLFRGFSVVEEGILTSPQGWQIQCLFYRTPPTPATISIFLLLGIVLKHALKVPRSSLQSLLLGKLKDRQTSQPVILAHSDPERTGPTLLT